MARKKVLVVDISLDLESTFYFSTFLQIVES